MEPRDAILLRGLSGVMRRPAMRPGSGYVGARRGLSLETGGSMVQDVPTGPLRLWGVASGVGVAVDI